MFSRITLLLSVTFVTGLHAQQTIIWKETDPRCSHRYLDKGLLFRSIGQNNLTVSVALSDTNGHYELSVIVKNERIIPIDILVENIAIWSAADRTAKTVHPLPLSKVEPKLPSDFNVAYIKWLNEIALASSTIEAHHGVAGMVFFPRENKKRNNVVVYVPIGGDILEFEMSPQFH
jgi:hypothetical protein